MWRFPLCVWVFVLEDAASAVDVVSEQHVEMMPLLFPRSFEGFDLLKELSKVAHLATHLDPRRLSQRIAPPWEDHVAPAFFFSRGVIEDCRLVTALPKAVRKATRLRPCHLTHLAMPL